MAFTDPQSVTINAVPISLPRVESVGTKSIYSAADMNTTLVISHQKTGKKRIRHQVKLDKRAIVADPLTAENDYGTTSVYLVIDEPEYGFTDTELDYYVDALIAWLSSANIAKVLGNEH